MQEIVYHSNYQLENNYWWFVARNNIVFNIFKKYCQLKSEDDVLDVGCGTGGFASKLIDSNKVIGIDTSDLALEYSKKRGIKYLYNTILKDFNHKEFNIKAITILDVIEHIENDKEVVKQCYDLLPNNGYLVATVPAYQWMWSKHDEIHYHYRRYNLQNFKELLEKAGFEVAYSTYFNTLLFPLALLKRFIDKIIKKQVIAGDSVEHVSPFVNKIFTKIFQSELNLIPKVSLPFGMSILCVCKKIIKE